MKGFSIIVAVDDKMGIGRGNDLPWRLSSDMKHFKEVTTSPGVSGALNVVIMGRKTWESLPVKFRPLPGRLNVVITSQKDYLLPSGVMVFSSLDAAVEFFSSKEAGSHGEVFVIGGAQVYAQALGHALCRKLYVTHVAGDYLCDVKFPQIPSFFRCTKKTVSFQENNYQLFFCIYEKH